MVSGELQATKRGREEITAAAPADAGLEREYRSCMALALCRLHREFPAVDEDERLEIYDDVWAQLLERRAESGFWPDRLEPYLVAAVVKRARFEHRKRVGRRTEPSDLLDELPQDAGRPVDDGVIEALDAQNYAAIIEALSPIQRAVAKMRFGWGLTPREISETLDLDQKRCYREIENATHLVRKRAVAVRRGQHVRRYEKLLRRYIAGTASDAERADARQLIETSSQAKMIAAEMFRASRELGALLPAPAVADGHNRSRAVEVIAGAKQQLLDVVAGTKQHATAAYVRASEAPQQLSQHVSSVRPGSAALAVTGCLAAAGGATLCEVENVNPAKALYDVVDAKPAPKPADDEKKPDRELRAPVPAQPRSTPPAATKDDKPTPPPPAPAPAAPERVAPQDEFSPEGQQAPRPKTPAPVKGGAPEFL